MQDRPEAAEMLDAVAGFLLNDVREWVPRERRFQILVAANLCAVVARELRAGDELDLADDRLFRDLIERAGAQGPGEAASTKAAAAQLVRLIRAGDLDDDLPQVLAALRPHVRRKVDVTRPGYAD